MKGWDCYECETSHDLLMQSVDLRKRTRNKKKETGMKIRWLQEENIWVEFEKISENNFSTKQMKMQFKEAGCRNYLEKNKKNYGTDCKRSGWS